MELEEALGAEAETGNKSKGVPEPYSRTGSGGLVPLYLGNSK